jgi:uncharacterized protein YecE (DUF72 family)
MDAPRSTSTSESPPAVAWRIGTMGFSYEDWSGPFYPLSMKSGDWLSWYARHFDTVELDTTFYAAPTPDRVARWTAVTPDEFCFCLKTPRAITHDAPLAVGAAPMREFVEVCRGFGSKLGAILIQFAPSFMADQFGVLDAFLATLPEDLNFAVELRHRSWGTPDTLRMLHERRCAFVSAEYSVRPARVFATADFLYLRWIGIHHQFPRYGQELLDPTEPLTWWKGAIDAVLPKVRRVFGLFNNDYAGYAIGTANRFKRMVGLPVREPSIMRTSGLFDQIVPLDRIDSGRR